jgi:RimJ/RimL family protein N-acetyltransferase
VTFDRDADPSLVASIVSQPQVWRRINYESDVNPGLEECAKRLNEVKQAGGVLFVAVSDPEPIGIFILAYSPEAPYPDSAEVYYCFLPSVWGRAEDLVRECLAWVWRETPITRLIGRTPSCNRLAVRLALAVGFREYGRIDSVGVKYGKKFDIIKLDIRAPLND